MEFFEPGDLILFFDKIKLVKYVLLTTCNIITMNLLYFYRIIIFYGKA